MGLFKKAKESLGGKNWVKGYYCSSCPNAAFCDGRIYREGYDNFFCDYLGRKLEGEAYWNAYDAISKQEYIDNGYSEEYAQELIERARAKRAKEGRENAAKKQLQEEIRARGETREFSDYDPKEFTEKILIGQWCTKNDFSRKRDKNGRTLLAYYHMDSDKEHADEYTFYSHMKDSVNRRYGFKAEGDYFYGEHDKWGEESCYATVSVMAEQFVVDWQRTSKDTLVLLAKNLIVRVQINWPSGVLDHPEYFYTKYGSVKETEQHYQDWAIGKFEYEIKEQVRRYLASHKRRYYGMDDFTYENIYIDYVR